MPTLTRTDRPATIRRVMKGTVDDVSRAKRTITSIVTTDDVDRYDEVIVARGIDVTAFRENPVVLWCHCPGMPIGKNLSLKRTTKNDVGVWVAKTLFAETDLSEEIFQLYAEGFLNGWSIGANPDWSSYSAPTPEEVKARPAWKKARALIRKCELVEYSAVSIPANASALGNDLEKLAGAELVRAIRESETWDSLLGHEPEATVTRSEPEPPTLPPLPPALPPLVGRTLNQAIAEQKALVARMTSPEAARQAAQDTIDRLKGRI